MKYNFLLTLLLLSNNTYNAGHTYTMQVLVKEVTLKNHSNNGLAILHGIKLSPYILCSCPMKKVTCTSTWCIMIYLVIPILSLLQSLSKLLHLLVIQLIRKHQHEHRSHTLYQSCTYSLKSGESPGTRHSEVPWIQFWTQFRSWVKHRTEISRLTSEKITLV